MNTDLNSLNNIRIDIFLFAFGDKPTLKNNSINLPQFYEKLSFFIKFKRMWDIDSG